MLAVGQFEIEKEEPLREHLADSIYVTLRYHFDRILPKGSDGCHIRRFPLFPFFSQLIPYLIHDFSRTRIEKLNQTLQSHLSQERKEVLESLVRFQNNQVQIQKSDW
jgi:hypothetical protein